MNEIHGKRVFQKTFTDETPKAAYLKACKWLAKNVYSKPSLSEHVAVNIVKLQEKEPSFLITVYAVEDEKEIKDNFCNRCKVLQNTFYNNASPNCLECKMNAITKEFDKQLCSKYDFIKKVLEGKNE